MELNFINSSYGLDYILDDYISLLWIERYNEEGEFELKVIPSDAVLEAINNTAYLSIKQSDKWMVPDIYDIKLSKTNSNILTLKGKSIENILNRRIIWDPVSIDGYFETEIINLLNDNVISPTDTDRTINIIATELSGDSYIESLLLETQLGGENLYSFISSICKKEGLGFKLYFNSVSSLFKFKLYNGVNRSYDQTNVPAVAYTFALDNFINSTYIRSSRDEKTICLVAGEEGVGNVKTYNTAVKEPYTGINRKELYLPTSVNRNTGSISEAEYLTILEAKGLEELEKYKIIEQFDGETIPEAYEYNLDFNLGDILQIADGYGHESKSRVSEMVFFQDSKGYVQYPTFEKTT